MIYELNGMRTTVQFDDKSPAKTQGVPRVQTESDIDGNGDDNANELEEPSGRVRVVPHKQDQSVDEDRYTLHRQGLGRLALGPVVDTTLLSHRNSFSGTC